MTRYFCISLLLYQDEKLFKKVLIPLDRITGPLKPSCSNALSIHSSEECHAVWWRCDCPWVIQWARRNKERPSVQLLAQLCQPFQVEHLTDGNSPPGKTVVVPISELAGGSYIDLLAVDTYIDQSLSRFGRTSKLTPSPATATIWLSHMKRATDSLWISPVCLCLCA